MRRCACDPWELNDVDGLLRDLNRQLGVALGANCLAVVDLEDKLIGARRLPAASPTYLDYDDVAWDVIRPAIVSILGEERGFGPPNHVAHIVRCKPGRAVLGRNDVAWGRALLHGQQALDCFVGEVIVLTPHGWRMSDRRGDLTPSLLDFRDHLRAVP
jgi:hypothetical protein